MLACTLRLLLVRYLAMLASGASRVHDHYQTTSDVPGYRLGDAIQVPKKTDAVVKAFPDSIATEYVLRSSGVPRNYDLLAAIVRRRWSAARPPAAPPPPNALIVHLRLGDVANRLGNDPQRVWAHGSLRHQSRSWVLWLILSLHAPSLLLQYPSDSVPSSVSDAPNPHPNPSLTQTVATSCI